MRVTFNYIYSWKLHSIPSKQWTADRRASKLEFTQETWMMKIHLHLQNQNDVTCLLKIRSQLPEAGPGLAKCQFLTKLTLLLDMKIFYIAPVSERIFPQYFRRRKANSLYCVCLKCNQPFWFKFSALMFVVDRSIRRANKN